jgi:hypothetical protein
MSLERSCALASGLLAAALVGCGGDVSIDDASDPPIDDESSAYAAESAGCSRKAIYAQTRDEDRFIIDRALKWVDEHVMYSQSKTTDGFRRDCSGFVSMAWKLFSHRPGLVTWTMDEASHRIGWNELRPGDAIDQPRYHVMLFAGWANKAHTDYCAIEEHATGRPAEITVHAVSAMHALGFKPIRLDR